MFRRILVPLDGSPFGEHALPPALALAERWGAEVELVRVATLGAGGTSPRPGARDPRDLAMEAAGEYLEEVRSRIADSGFSGKIGSEVIPPGNVARSLVSHVVETEADLAVMTTHGRGPLQRAWLGSSADGFIRHGPVPTLLIRPVGEPDDDAPPLDEQARPFGRVLIPLDGSDASERMTEMALPFTVGAEFPRFILLRAIPPFVPGGSPYLPHVIREGEAQEQVKEAAQGYLDKVAARLADTPVGVATQVIPAGQPAVAILEAAEEVGADLIALSTHGRGGVARLLLGSVADKVVRGSSVPVLVYREAE